MQELGERTRDSQGPVKQVEEMEQTVGDLQGQADTKTLVARLHKSTSEPLSQGDTPDVKSPLHNTAAGGTLPRCPRAARTPPSFTLPAPHCPPGAQRASARRREAPHC